VVPSGLILRSIQLTLGPDLRESRRLQLAAEQGKGLGLILIERRAQTSSAQTRWMCQPQIPLEPASNEAGQQNGTCSGPWLWELTKNKSGIVGRWSVKWTGGANETNNVHMVATTAA